MSPQVTTIGRLSSLRLTLRNYSSSHHYYDDVLATGAALAASAVAVSSVALFMQSSSTSNETASIDDAVTTTRRRSFPINFSYASSNNNDDDESPSCTSAATKYYVSNLLTSSQFTSCEPSTSNYNANNHPSPSSAAEKTPLYKSNEKMVIECDYVVVGGHGKAGKSAINTIRKLDPTANIVTIDPNHYNDNNINSPNNRSRGSKINHLKTHASFIDHGNKVVQLHNTDAVIHFRKSVLLATGSRGSPPPNECIHQNARNRILELRSTSLPSTTTSLQQNNQMNQEVSLPVLDPPTVRSLSMMAASEGATVAIMGSGFEALELAASLSRMQQQQQRKQTNRGVNNGSNGDNNNDNKKVILLFGNAGPMTTRLPRYLSAAVTKRLRQCGIEVEERSMTRYISMESSSTTKAVVPQLELYTVKSYDNLDSRRITADLLVLAPNVDGATGTSVIPAIHKSYHYQQYLPWSSLISPPVLTSFLDDGKVVTNSEYQAASNIYAAGSVTRSPNAQNGRADVAGGTSACSTRVGEIAARNMIQNESNKTIIDSGTNDGGAASIPVWRSDEVPYLHNSDERNEPIVKQTSAADEKLSSLALYSMGVHALCVGKCDSETQATHGFWWTNTNQQQSNNDDSNNSGGTRRMNTVGPNAFMRRITRKATSKVNSSKATGSGSLPVYGSGVVFYLDKTGSISGVMLWGLPFSQYPQDVRSGLNHLLVYRMKEVIGSNGHVAIRDHSRKIAEDQAGLNVDLSLLSFLHLVEESKLLASMALSGSRPENNVKIDVNGKPLHRYTPIKSSELSSLGKLKRREMGHVAEEDDLFYPTTTLSTTTMVDSEETTRPPSLKRIYPMHGGATTINVEKELELRQLLVDRGRPSKEEPLWIRQGEEHRFVNKREAMADNFYRNIQKGRFSDGTDAVKQAPVPQVYLDAKEQVKSWTGGSSSQNSEDVPEGEDDSRR